MSIKSRSINVVTNKYVPPTPTTPPKVELAASESNPVLVWVPALGHQFYKRFKLHWPSDFNGLYPAKILYLGTNVPGRADSPMYYVLMTGESTPRLTIGTKLYEDGTTEEGVHYDLLRTNG